MLTAQETWPALPLAEWQKFSADRKLATDTAANMKPLPPDDQNPLTGNATHDDLILWLAYKEAKALIQFDAASPVRKSEE